ncbi:MAG: cation transporter [Planctomycetes bacterium]|nr:cation transporter [Planctomycetota bacterium]
MRRAPRAGMIRAVATATHARERGHLAVMVVSLAVAVALLAVKFWAWACTGSQAIFSDALESVVNVAASAVALGTLAYAGRPADRDHPFGHGKVEFFAAAFEGGLVFCAALAILWQAALAFRGGTAPTQLDLGLLLTIAAGTANGALGWWLLRYGRRHRSAAIEADGLHVLSDFWTSLGVVVGLLLVRTTGLWWFDPLAAALMGVLLLVTGFGIVRRAAGGLLDEEDPDLLRRVVEQLGRRVRGGIIRIHHLRAIRSGRFHHVSAHVVVPEFWTVQRAHDAAEQLAAEVLRGITGEADIDFHTDPCERAWCRSCDVDACSVRAHAFVQLEPLTVDEAVAPDPHAHARQMGGSAMAAGVDRK